MHSLKIASVILVLLCSLVHCAFGQNKTEHPSSNFEPPIFNAEAWESGDCLVRVHHTCDATGESQDGKITGALEEEEEFFRFFVDYANGQLTCHRRVKRTVTDFDIDNGPIESVNALAYSVALDSKKGTWEVIAFTGKAHKRLVGSLKDGMPSEARSSLPDYRAFWYMGQTEPDTFNHLKKLVRAAEGWDSKRFKQVALNDNKFKLELSSHISAGQIRYPALRTFVFSNESLMPLSTTMHRLREGVKVPYTSRIMEWEEKDGVYFPTSIHEEETGYQVHSSKRPLGDLEMESKFHWFEFNTNIKADAFSLSKISRLEDIVLLTDPETVDATKLLEKK